MAWNLVVKYTLCVSLAGLHKARLKLTTNIAIHGDGDHGGHCWFHRDKNDDDYHDDKDDYVDARTSIKCGIRG